MAFSDTKYILYNKDKNDFELLVPIIGMSNGVSLDNTCKSHLEINNFISEKSNIIHALINLKQNSKIENIRKKAEFYIDEITYICSSTFESSLNASLILHSAINDNSEDNNIYVLNLKAFERNKAEIKQFDYLFFKNTFNSSKSIDEEFIREILTEETDVTDEILKNAKEKIQFDNKDINKMNTIEKIAITYGVIFLLIQEKNSDISRNSFKLGDIGGQDITLPLDLDNIKNFLDKNGKLIRAPWNNGISQIFNNDKKISVEYFKSIYSNIYDKENIENVIKDIGPVIIEQHKLGKFVNRESSDLLEQISIKASTSQDKDIHIQNISFLLQAIFAYINCYANSKNKTSRFYPHLIGTSSFKLAVQNHVKSKSSRCIILAICSLFEEETKVRFNDKEKEIIQKKFHAVWNTLTSNWYNGTEQGLQPYDTDHLDEMLLFFDTPGKFFVYNNRLVTTLGNVIYKNEYNKYNTIFFLLNIYLMFKLQHYFSYGMFGKIPLIFGLPALQFIITWFIINSVSNFIISNLINEHKFSAEHYNIGNCVKAEEIYSDCKSSEKLKKENNYEKSPVHTLPK